MHPFIFHPHARRVTSCAAIALFVGIASLTAGPVLAQVADQGSASPAGSGSQTAQTPPPATAPASDQALPEVEVTAKKLNAARDNIQTNVGASAYTMDQQAIESPPQGQNAPLNQVLLQMPGVNQDNLANGAFMSATSISTSSIASMASPSPKARSSSAKGSIPASCNR